MLLPDQVAPVHHGSIAVSVLRMESLVEPGCVVKKKKRFCFCSLKIRYRREQRAEHRFSGSRNPQAMSASKTANGVGIFIAGHQA